jgi:hypothetical protein
MLTTDQAATAQPPTIQPTQPPTLQPTQPPTLQPTLQPTPTQEPTQPPVVASCSLINNNNALVNVRAAPNLEANVVTQLAPNDRVLAIGRLADSSWWQIPALDGSAWILASVVTADDGCAALAVVQP